MSAPPTGCPSAEITRQLSTCVPRLRFGGAATVTVAFSAATAGVAIGSPSGPMRRIRSGETGSLKVRVSAGGAAGSTAPSAGAALTSEAWARAGDAGAATIDSVASNAATYASTLAPRATTYIFGTSLSPGAGEG